MDTGQVAMTERCDAITEVLQRIRSACTAYVFRCSREVDLQEQVATALGYGSITTRREVIAEHGRYDLLVEQPHATGPIRVVLELKMKGSAAAVERQAQRYAMTDDVDAVVIVTTSARLAHSLSNGGQGELGGKMFRTIVLRAF